MNELANKFGPGLAILCFPCNQFGHQENAMGEEILTSLQHVRPGNGFKPKVEIFEKCDVNGARSSPVFRYLKEKLPFPYDDRISFMTNPQSIIWTPVHRSDIAWNFEKFLVTADGVPYRRYSRRFQTIDLGEDIARLLGNTIRRR